MCHLACEPALTHSVLHKSHRHGLRRDTLSARTVLISINGQYRDHA